MGEFPALVLSAALFFGSYAVMLLITRETLVLDIVSQFLGKLLKKEKK